MTLHNSSAWRIRPFAIDHFDSRYVTWICALFTVLILGRAVSNAMLYAFLGVALVVFNGKFILKLNPIGDMLTLGASIMWVLYSIIILKVQGKYSSAIISRKIFFYGVLTLLPYSKSIFTTSSIVYASKRSLASV